MSRPETPVAERFWAKVQKGPGCWEWTARRDKDGYGKFGITAQKSAMAHRFALQLSGISIPNGAEVDHICHTRACVRPDHLRLTTHKQNSENRAGASRSNNSSGVRGVTWDATRQKWKACVRHNGTLVNIGYFDEIAEAEQAAIAKRNELFTHNDADRKVAA